MNNVENFLKQFHTSNNIDDVFTGNCCYWFAVILFGRFIRDGAIIVCDDTPGRFGTLIKDRVYDITGDVTDKYDWIPWESIVDSSLKDKIVRDYIMF